MLPKHCSLSSNASAITAETSARTTAISCFKAEQMDDTNAERFNLQKHR
jgi:hypothetical protein